MIKGFAVETIALTPGLFVKKGTAENGIIKAGAGERAYGLSKGSEYTESIAVGDHADVALPGEVAKVMLAGTLTAFDEVAPDADGKAVAIGAVEGDTYFRGAVLLESGVAGELVDALVTCDWKTGVESGGVAPTVAGQMMEIAGKQYLAVYLAGTETAGDVIQVNYQDTAGQEVVAGTPATTAFATKTAVVIATPGGAGLAWVQVGGLAEAGVEGTTDVAAGDFLEVLNTESAFKKDGASRTANSGAVAVDAQAADSVVVVTVMLINESHVIAAT